MTLTLLLLMTIPADAPPGALVLLADATEYKQAAETAQMLDGLLERTPTTGTLGAATRFNAYRLRYTDAAGKEQVRELHAPGKAYLLASHLGKKVRVHGKAVDTKADGKTYAVKGKVTGSDVAFTAGGREYKGRLNGKNLEIK